MSVLEESQQKMLDRLADLEAGRREYDELLEAVGKLGLEYDGDAAMKGRANGSATPARATRSAPSRSRRARGRKIAPRGQRREQVLAIVNEHPDGISVADVGKKLGLADATSLFRIQKQLVHEGTVSKDGALMKPVPASG